MLVNDLVEFTTRHQVYLERLKAGEIQRTDPLFVALAAGLTRILYALGVENLGALTQLQATKLVLDIRKLHTDQYQKQLERFVKTLHDLTFDEREFELKSLDEVSLDELTPDDGENKDALWATVQERPFSSSGKVMSEHLGEWMGHEVTRAADLTRKAITEGWLPLALLYAFRGSKAGGFMDGLLGSAKRNTETAIRTAVQHVSSVARWSTMENTVFRPTGAAGDAVEIVEGVVKRIPRTARVAAERLGLKVGDNVGLLGYRWVSILDSKTSQICRSLDGRVFSFGKGPVPPAHPNCRSNIIAEMRGRWTKRDAKGRFASDDRERDTPDGAVPAKTTYYDWLKRQPAEFQDDALGVTRAELFRKGGLSAEAFARLNLDRNFHPLTLDEMRKRAPLVFKRAGI